LVIGAQCEALGELSWLPPGPGPVDVTGLGSKQRLLVELRDLLVSGPGECSPVSDGIDGLSMPGLLLNPTAAQASAAVRAAMNAAHTAEAVLVMHVLAHGCGYQNDPAGPVRHLLYAWDTVAEPIDTQPESRAWEPYADIADRVPNCRGMTGLVLVVDACRASWAKTGIAAWSGVRGGLMSAVLAASGDHPAWDACLTRTVVDVLRDGLARDAHHRRTLVTELLALDIEPLANESCQHQTARLDGHEAHNPILKIGRNRASEQFAAELGVDAPTAGLMLRLSHYYTEHAVAAVADEIEANRVVSIVGPAGSGKSTLAAALRRAPEESDLPIGLFHAAAFVSSSPGVVDLARSLIMQLRAEPGFREAAIRFERDNQYRWDALDVWQRELIGPLGVLRRQIRILVDGLDHLDGTGHAQPVHRALRQLLEDAPRARLVVTSRRDPGLPDSTVVPMPTLDDDTARRFLHARDVDPAAHDRIIGLAAGRWLVLALAADSADTDAVDTLEGLYGQLIAQARVRRGPLADDMLAVLAAAGAGPVLPVDVLYAALPEPGRTSRAELLEVLGDEALYRVIDRSNAGTPEDRVGLFHQTLTDYLHRDDLAETHLAIAQALDDLASDHDPTKYRTQPVAAYAFDGQARHWWYAGRPERVVASLARQDVIPRVNLARWQQWAPQLQEQLGADHPDTLTARFNVAYWTGRTGDAHAALALFEQLLPDRERVLGADHPDTLGSRGTVADWTGQTGDWHGALDLFEQLLPDQERVLGADHPDALITRGNIARWTGATGDAQGALDLFEQLLPDQERVLGADHPDALITRGNVALWTGETGNRKGARALFEALLPDRERVFGADHPDTLATRADIAYWTGWAGDAQGARALFEQLLPDRERVLGADHPDTVDMRGHIAFWTGEAGDAQGARALFEALLPARKRVLGAYHPGTLNTRGNIARWTGETGDSRGALALFEALLPDFERVLGADHPDTLDTRGNIARWTGETGDSRSALALFEALLPDLERVLGADHPNTLNTHEHIDRLRAQLGAG
jgi:energy-coupling factor transporter ATP-binding protein EcfA2